MVTEPRGSRGVPIVTMRPKHPRWLRSRVIWRTFSKIAVTKRHSKRHVLIVGTRNRNRASSSSSNTTAGPRSKATANPNAGAARALVVELLSSAIFRLIVEGRVPRFEHAGTPRPKPSGCVIRDGEVLTERP